MREYEVKILERDVDAIRIPDGDTITLTEGTVVQITQALGGTFTVVSEGYMARIDGQDADALGMPVPERHEGQTVATGPVDEEAVWAQLATCFDPEIPVNIVDLGLVYDVRIIALSETQNRVEIDMTLTAPGCGMGFIIADDVKYKIEHVPNVTEVQVETVFDPPWDQSMMSEAAKLQMGMF